MTRSYCLCNSICVCVRLRLNIRKIIIIKGTSIDDLEIIQEQNGSLLISSTAFVAYLENSSSHFAENEGHSDSTSSEDDSFKEQHQEEFQFIADACRHCRGLGNNIFPHPRIDLLLYESILFAGIKWFSQIQSATRTHCAYS